MNGRTIAIGDIHGCDAALRAILDAIAVQTADTLVMLGDYVNRGPQTRQVIDRLLNLSQRCQVIPLLGNHEEMMLAARHSPYPREFWLHFGGDKTLMSYGPEASLADIPAEHWEFIERCQLIHVTERHFFTHASYDPQQSLNAQPTQLLLWQSLRGAVPAGHTSSKIAIVGHTPQQSGDVLDLDYLKRIVTGCVYGGYLTALEDTGQVWQVDQHGQHRDDRDGSEQISRGTE